MAATPPLVPPLVPPSDQAPSDQAPSDQAPSDQAPSDPAPAPSPAPGPGSAPAFDVLLSGTVFLDIIFTGLPRPPAPGTEVWAEGLGSCPGGIANLAVALSRLQLRTALSAAFGEDVYGDFCWEVLAEQEGVDLSYCRRYYGWHSPVTVSMAMDRDRSMVTHGHRPPVSADEILNPPPRTRACFVHVGGEDERWVAQSKEQGALLFADIGWDRTELWAPELLRRLEQYDVFLPNDAEAQRYTRCDTPERAAMALAEHVPVVVVTRGGGGAVAVDSSTGEVVDVPGLNVAPLDSTGAGDVFGAGFVLGTLSGWPLADRVRFANLCAALSVQHFGGSLSAPGWMDIATWWRTVSRRPDDELKGYGFLEDVVPNHTGVEVRRASATIRLRASS